jgi:branched-chain amino acid transport system ATP-binding protein
VTDGSEARSPGAHAGPGGVSAPLLEVRDLEARYGAVLAVRGLSLRVGEGEIVALLGANGAGKTTTLSCIAGLHRSRTGSISLSGEDLGKLAPERIVRRGVALTPEGRRLFASLTVAENLEIGAARARTGQEERRERLLDLFPILRERLRTPAGSLSGGEQQQLAIARSLMSSPRLLLLDEPTLGLAPKLVTAVFGLIARLRDEEGLSILLVEQNVHQALDVCDRAYVLRTGSLEAEGTPTELRASRSIEQAYLGRAVSL